jgi:hypothetical protein
METWETVCAFLETLPGAKQDPPGGREVVRVHGKVIAFPATNERSRPPEMGEDEEFVVIKVDKFERMALLHDDPQTFFVTPQYESYPGVIVRLHTVDTAHLHELLLAAWKMVAPRRVVRGWEER